MSVRTRLVVLTTALQLGSLLFLSYGVFAVLRTFGERQVAASEDLLRHAVARTALDALIQRDQVQLLSYLNFLKGQYPALSHARVSWRKGDRASNLELGKPAPGARLRERRVEVSDPSQPGSSVEVVFGVDENILRAAVDDSQRRTLKVLLAVGGLTALLGLAISIFVAHALTKPLAGLGRVAEEIGRGRLGARLDWESDDEVGRLVRVFNMMSSRLEELDQTKKNFVSSVTHELRSPLGAIESFIPLIRDRQRAGDRASLSQVEQYLERIEVNVRRLSGFINDLLDVAKIEKGKMECSPRPMELAPVAAEVCQFFEPRARQLGVTLASRVEGMPPVLGDAERVRQVLVNLVANALKFTPSGGQVAIGAEQVRDAGRRFVEIVVSDTGRGMDEADRQRLFSPFSQGRNTAEGTAGHKGTGLGLYIVKSIVEQHGGRVEVESAPGRGTRMRFSLPVAA